MIEKALYKRVFWRDEKKTEKRLKNVVDNSGGVW